jgi:anti-sigma B factor antagonist
MLRIIERQTGDVVILDLVGTITSGAPAGAVVDTVRKVVLGGCRKVLLNMARARSSDASGVSAPVGALLAAREAGAEIKLASVVGGIDDLRIVAALYRYFSVFDSPEEALDSFREAGAADAVGAAAA